MQWYLDGKRYIRSSHSTDYALADQLLRQLIADGVVPKLVATVAPPPERVQLTAKCIVCGEEYPRHKGRSLTCVKPACRAAAPSKVAELRVEWLKDIEELRADSKWEEHHGVTSKRRCRECGKPLYEITEAHMSSHGTTFAESSRKYGGYSRHCRERMDGQKRKARECRKRTPMTPERNLARGAKVQRIKEANRPRTVGEELEAFRIDYRGMEKKKGITDYVICLRCGAHVVMIGSHLKYTHHEPNTKQYRKDFPGARLVSIAINKRNVEVHRKSPKVKERSKEAWKNLQARLLPRDLGEKSDSYKQIVPVLIADHAAGGKITNRQINEMFGTKVSDSTFTRMRDYAGVPGQKFRPRLK